MQGRIASHVFLGMTGREKYHLHRHLCASGFFVRGPQGDMYIIKQWFQSIKVQFLSTTQNGAGPGLHEEAKHITAAVGRSKKGADKCFCFEHWVHSLRVKLSLGIYFFSRGKLKCFRGILFCEAFSFTLVPSCFTHKITFDALNSNGHEHVQRPLLCILFSGWA